MHRWSEKELHEEGADLSEGQHDELRRRVGVRQAIVQSGRSGEMDIRRTVPPHAWSLAISRIRMAGR